MLPKNIWIKLLFPGTQYPDPVLQEPIQESDLIRLLGPLDEISETKKNYLFSNPHYLSNQVVSWLKSWVKQNLNYDLNQLKYLEKEDILFLLFLPKYDIPEDIWKTCLNYHKINHPSSTFISDFIEEEYQVFDLTLTEETDRLKLRSYIHKKFDFC